MSSEWSRLQIKDLGRIVTGKTPSTSRPDYFDGDIPFLTPTDMTDGVKVVSTSRSLTQSGLSTIKNCLVPKGVAVSCIGWQMGKTVLVLEPTVTNQQINTVVVDESRFDLHFTYYLLSSMREKIFQFGATATRTPIINKSSFGELSIVVPSLREQTQIASLLTGIDERIALLRETNATLEAIAQALFKSWFVDFDPVHANAGTQAPSLPPEIQALFPATFTDSLQGPIPEGWVASVLGDICHSNGGFIQTGPFGSQLHAEDYIPDGTPVVMPKDIVNRRVEPLSTAKIGESDVSRLARHQLQPGDIVFSRRGDVEKHALIGAIESGWICGTGCLLVRPGMKCLSPAFISRALDLPTTRQWLVRHAVGATMPNLNTGILAAVPIIQPNPDVLVAFDKLVGEIDFGISHNLEKIGTLTILRDTLLPRLISGQLLLPKAPAATAGVI